MLACALEQLSVVYLATFCFWVRTSEGGRGGIAAMLENIFPSDLWEVHNKEFSLYTRVPSLRLFFYIVRK